MGGEPQPGEPGDRGDNLDRALFGLRMVWFGLFAGGLVVVMTMAVIVMSGGGPRLDLGDLAYLFLAAVPLGLFAAFVVAPAVTSNDPGETVRGTPSGGWITYEGWEGTKPDEAFYWFPSFATHFLVRAAILDGAAIACGVGFFVTAEWAVLGGAVVLVAALAAQVPTRSAAESFAAAAQSRQAGGG